MAYLSVSRELLNGSFWESLASFEKGIIMDLIAMVPMRAYTVNLYGMQINLEAYEICFFAKTMAKKFDISIHVFRSLINKLSQNNIVVKKRRQITHTETDTETNTGRSKNNNSFFTSLTFCPSVFGIDTETRERSGKNSHKTTPKPTPKPTHNQEVTDLKEEEVFKTAREKNFIEYSNPLILLRNDPALNDVITENAIAYFRQSFECRTEDLENMFRLFLKREEASGIEFLKLKEMQRRFALFLERSYKTKLTHDKKSKHDGNMQQQPESKREKSDDEKRRESEEAAVLARLPRFGGSGARSNAERKKKRRHGTEGAD
ncbi:MAG: hypothetical protein ACRCX4_00445 [Bacteroidales bacterium]